MLYDFLVFTNNCILKLPDPLIPFAKALVLFHEHLLILFDTVLIGGIFGLHGGDSLTELKGWV